MLRRESIEILWIELRGRNKNTPFLIGVVYQPISNETERLVFLKGLNIFLVRFIQNGMVL